MKTLLSVFIIVLFLLFFSSKSSAAPSARTSGYFVLKIYHFSTATQEATIDSFLQYHHLPFLHSSKINNVGVFKPIANDTAKDKKIYLFIPFKSLKQWEKLSVESTENTVSGDNGFVNAPYNKPAYLRLETILLKAFPLMAKLAPSKLTGPKRERVYELRSYEGSTEKYFRSKVKMFNEGGEIALFTRLGFNAVFYSEVVFGSRMPNLMYMISFENMNSRDEHWKTFVGDPAWKKMAAIPEYQHTVSHIDSWLLRPTEYSDL